MQENISRLKTFVIAILLHTFISVKKSLFLNKADMPVHIISAEKELLADQELWINGMCYFRSINVCSNKINGIILSPSSIPIIKHNWFLLFTIFK